MALRWYTTVIDAHDIEGLGRWWAETLGWQVVYEADAETVPAEQWGQVGPGLVFVPVPEAKTVKNRLHLDLAPHTSDDRDAEIARMLERGAALVDVGQPADASFTVLSDPEGNEFCVLSARDR